MKKTDIAMIILIAAVSVMASYFAVNALMGDASTEAQTVKTIEAIDAAVEDPDPEIFNEKAINPAVEVQITPVEQ